MDFSLTSLIDDYIKSRDPKEYTSWRASSLGGCPRKHFYKRLGIKETTPPDERTNRVFQAGHIFHKFIQDIAEEGTTLSEVELFDKDLDLGGRYDLLVNTGGKKILYDIKTQHSRSFWWMEKSNKTMAEQYPHHVRQLMSYMLMLKRLSPPVDEGRILYVSKDDLCTKEVSYLLTPEREQEVLDELKMLNKHWKEKTLPECTCHKLFNGKGPSYCDYGNPNQEKKTRTECCSEKLWKK